MTHSFPFEQFQCDARPRRDGTRRSRAMPRLSCRHGEESRRNARNKRDETGPVGCASCHLHCVSPACLLSLPLPFPPPLLLSLTFPSPSPSWPATIPRASSAPPSSLPRLLLGYPCLLFAARFRKDDRPSSAPGFSRSGIRCSLLSPREGGTIAVGGVRVRHSTPNHSRAGASAIEMFN